MEIAYPAQYTFLYGSFACSMQNSSNMLKEGFYVSYAKWILYTLHILSELIYVYVYIYIFLCKIKVMVRMRARVGVQGK